MHTYIHTYMHAYIHTYMHAYIHACMHAYIHTYIYIHACIHDLMRKIQARREQATEMIRGMKLYYLECIVSPTKLSCPTSPLSYRRIIRARVLCLPSPPPPPPPPLFFFFLRFVHHHTKLNNINMKWNTHLDADNHKD